MTFFYHLSYDNDRMLPKHLVITNIFTNFASMKLNSMMKHHTDAKQVPLYPRIQENIRSASFRLNINVDDEWLPDYEDTF